MHEFEYNNYLIPFYIMVSYFKVIKMILKEFFANLAILVSLLFLYTQVSNNTPHSSLSPVKRKILVGILGGLLSNILMQYSIHIGVMMIDLRHIPILLLAYFGGALPAAVAMLLTIAGRLFIGINISAYASIAFIMGITFFSICISRSSLSNNVKKFLILTFANIVFSIVALFLIQDLTLLMFLIPIYWVVSSLSGYIAFYVLDLLRSSQMLFNKYRAESTIDGLTGLNNVRKFDEVFNQLVNDVKTNNQKLSLLYVDIDFFKQINDTYGHSEGDVVLKELGFLLQRCTRTFDVVSRNGGEEFTVLLLDCPVDRAVEIAEGIRKTVGEHSFTLNSSKEIKLTISIGLACYPDITNDPTMLIDAADKALYQAKKSGRNKVCVLPVDTLTANQISHSVML